MGTPNLEPVYLLFAAKLRHMRDTLGIEQAELAKRMDYAGRANIANIEAGKQRIMLHDIEKFAKAFGITPKHLMKGIWL